MKGKKLVCAALAAAALTAGLTAMAGAAYTDVPASGWAAEAVAQATETGIMQGVGNGQFGMGRSLTRAEFVTMLDRLMGWELTVPAAASFSDVAPSAWYYDEVETARAHGAVTETGAFRPNAAITRQEMAVMLVDALGYHTLAGQNSGLSIPFADVTADKGAIAIAYDCGIIKGKSADTFDPSGTARREEAAAMMMRLYDRTHSETDWLHGFYAISSWSQRALGAEMDAVSFGWSRLEWRDGAPYLNTTGENGNTWRVPDGSQDAVDAFAQAGVPANLAVQMTDQTAAQAILPDPSARAEVVRQLTAQVESGAYAGVTVDFEGMKGEALRNGLTAFVRELKAALGEKPVYVCVSPVIRHGGAYFDAYDYRALGDAADKVILMAHDYAAVTMDDASMARGFTTTPVTPFDEIYYALRCATDPETGVSDLDKLALGVSTSGTAGWTLADGRVTNRQANHPAQETILKRLAQPDTTVTYSETYRNPYMVYLDDSGNTNVLWYENGQSVSDKLALARMFGVTGVSVWRLGAIPTDPAWNVWEALTGAQ